MLINYHKPLKPMVDWSNYTWFVTAVGRKIFAFFPVSTNIIFMKLYHYLRHTSTGGGLGDPNFVEEICQFLKKMQQHLVLNSNMQHCQTIFWLLFLLGLQTIISMIDIHIYKQIYCNKNSLPSRENLKDVFGFFVNDAA